jgi:hypothetical protein
MMQVRGLVVTILGGASHSVVVVASVRTTTRVRLLHDRKRLLRQEIGGAAVSRRHLPLHSPVKQHQLPIYNLADS